MFEVRVSCARPVADGIRMLEVVPTSSSALPAFSAGAHIDVYRPGGVVRQYSLLCKGPNDQTAYRIGVLHEPNSRGGSKAVLALQEGASVQIGAPRNLFQLNPQAGNSVLLGGTRAKRLLHPMLLPFQGSDPGRGSVISRDALPDAAPTPDGGLY